MKGGSPRPCLFHLSFSFTQPEISQYNPIFQRTQTKGNHSFRLQFLSPGHKVEFIHSPRILSNVYYMPGTQWGLHSNGKDQ